MRKAIFILCIAVFVGSGLGLYLFMAARASNEKLSAFSSCKLGETYEVEKDLWILTYDYLQIPLVKPGIQAFDISDEELGSARPEMKIQRVGKLHKGDFVMIESYVEEAGWIPCKGNWYMANPMVRVKTGELLGKEFGISLLCDYQREKAIAYKTGKIAYMQLNSKYLIRNDTIGLTSR